MAKRVTGCCCVLIGFAVLLSAASTAQEITVAAAADLNYALQSLAAKFQQKTGSSVKLTFGSSGNLFAEIESGAPYDLYFSADLEYPEKLAAAGFVDPESIRKYADGRLVLWIPDQMQLDPTSAKMNVLLQPSVKRIAIANPEHAPYGRAAMAALQHFGVKDKVADKLVFGENVSQAAQFVESGNAQAGLLPLSLALSPQMKAAGKYWELPADSYPELRQAAAIVSSSKHKQVAQSFLDYVASSAGQAALEEYGFQVVNSK